MSKLKMVAITASAWITLLAVAVGHAAITENPAAAPPVLDAPHTSVPSGRHSLPASTAWLHVPRTRTLTRSINPAASTFITVAQYHTWVQVLWTTDTLYVRFTCRGAAHGVTFHANNQPLYQQDVVEIFLDVVGNMKHYAEIEVSPHGFHAVYRHSWAKPPAFPANKINWRQVAEYHHESLWNIPGLQTTAASLQKSGKNIGWVATMAIPIRPIFNLSHVPATTLHRHQHLRANFIRYIYLAAKHGKRTIHQLNWGSTMRGDPHVSPMAMGTIILSGREPLKTRFGEPALHGGGE